MPVIRGANMRKITGGACASLVAFLIVLSFGACGGDSSSPPTPSTPSRPHPVPTVVSVTITGVGALAVGEQGQFSATAVMSDGATQPCSSSATWQSSDPAVASVNSSGVVSALSGGSADIRATCGGATGTLHLTVPSVTYTLSGTVLDETGARVSDVLVELADGLMAGRNTTTDSAGTFTLAHVTGGTISVRLSKPGFDTRTQTLIVARDMGVVFSLRHTISITYTLSGTVRDEAGAAIGMATVLVMNGPTAGRAANTASNGSYSLTGVAAGACSILASKFGYTSSTQAVTVAGNATVNFTLKK